jgi:AcrR family transcriptional regulator
MLSAKRPSTDTVSCVLQAAQEVFIHAGFRASIDAVATRAGVARQTIYNNFNNKRTLFARAIEHSTQSLLTELTADETGDLPAQLENFALKLRQRVLNTESAHLFAMLSSEAARFPDEARDFFQSACMVPRQHLADRLHQCMQQGLLRQDDALDAAHFFFDTLLGIDLERLHFSGQRPDPQQEHAHVKRHVQRFLRAYAPV